MTKKRSIDSSRVCVIGGAGFLGSHLVNYLIEKRNCAVLVLDNLISGRPSYVNRKAEFTWWDIRNDPRELARLLVEHDIAFVFNYAAEPYVPECYRRPAHFFDVNAVAVLNVLTACDEAEVRGILQVSSAEIYGDMKGKTKETDLISPHSTYGVSKVAADGLVQVRWREARTPAIAMRQFNCVGERETHPYVIPEIISQLHKSPTVKLGNDSKRDFQYAGDAVRMAVSLLENGEFGEVYNIGSEEVIGIYDLAQLIGRIMLGGRIIIVEDITRKRPWEIWHLQSDNSKLYSVIDARPEVSLEEALAKTIEDFRVNDNRWSWESA